MGNSGSSRIKTYFTFQQLLMSLLITIYLFAPDDLFIVTKIYVSETPKGYV